MAQTQISDFGSNADLILAQTQSLVKDAASAAARSVPQRAPPSSSSSDSGLVDQPEFRAGVRRASEIQCHWASGCEGPTPKRDTLDSTEVMLHIPVERTEVVMNQEADSDIALMDSSSASATSRNPLLLGGDSTGGAVSSWTKTVSAVVQRESLQLNNVSSASPRSSTIETCGSVAKCRQVAAASVASNTEAQPNVGGDTDAVRDEIEVLQPYRNKRRRRTH